MPKITQLMLATLSACIFSLALGVSSAPTGTHGPLRFGAPVTVRKAVNIAKLEKDPAKFVGKTVRLEGVVKNVCQGSGCWVEVSAPNGASFVARSLDERILVPKDCQGRRIVVQGVVTAMPAKGQPAEAAHQHEAGDKIEPGHACPRPIHLVSTQGVELAAAK
jgi:hypothetical protein